MKFFLIFSSVFLLLSCKPKDQFLDLEFSPTKIVSENNRFALIVEPYVSLYDTPEDLNIIISHARRGDIYELKGSKIINNTKSTQIWYQIEDGWVLSTYVTLYSTKDKALSVAASLLTSQ